MRRLLLVLGLLAALFVSCGGQEAEREPAARAPALAGDEPVDIEVVEAVSPRQTAGPAIPPTWTPMPTPEADATPAAVDSPVVTRIGRTVHRVVEGDTLGDLAILYDVSVADIAQANGIVDLDHIEVDWELVIPGR